jgi:hypothetical protein
MSLADTTQVIGVFPGWTCRLRKRFIRDQVVAPDALTPGRRKPENMGVAQERKFLAPFLEWATTSGVLLFYFSFIKNDNISITTDGERHVASSQWRRSGIGDGARSDRSGQDRRATAPSAVGGFALELRAELEADRSDSGRLAWLAQVGASART